MIIELRKTPLDIYSQSGVVFLVLRQGIVLQREPHLCI